ncbi:MFS transporter [Clostridium botulinum]|uniref:MFS transporter n=1 Tax=Clostridium botulinum TaxID=1491 RepID=UPI0007745D0B|nr:MFS transporter [Clostridium botulinum]
MNKYLILSKNKNFLYSYISMLISSFGDSLSLLAFPLFAFNKTGSAMSSGIIMFSETIPWIIIAPLVGKYIDKGEKKKFLLIGDLIRTMTTILLVFADNMMIIYILVFVNGTFSSIFATTKSAMTTEMLGEDELDAGIKLSNVTKQIINIVGPSVGTIILIGLSVKILFLIDALTYLLSFILNSKIKLSKKVNTDNIENGESFMKSIKESIVYILNGHEIRYTLFIDCITTIFEAIISISLVVFIKESLAFKDSIYSIIITINTVGLIVGSFLLSELQKRYNSFKIIKIIGFLISGIFLINIFCDTVPLLGVTWFIYGVLLGIREVLIQLIFMKHIEDSKKGRVFSTANSMISISYITGFLLSGYLIDNIGIINTFIFSSIFSMALLLVFEILNKKISLETENEYRE